MNARRVAKTLGAGAAIVAVHACSPILYLVRLARERDPRSSLPLGAVVSASTDHPEGERHASCAGERDAAGDSDNAWSFIPPQSGAYEFRVHAQYDAVVAVYATRGDEELGCNDDDGASTDPRLAVRLEREHHYVVLVDGYRGDHGPYDLSVVALTPASPSPPPSASSRPR